MKIKRTTLLALIDNEMERIRTAVAQRNEQATHRNAQIRDTGELELREDWKAFAETINRCVGRQEPVTWDDVPHGLRATRSWKELKFYDPPKPRDLEDVEKITEYRRLDALRRLLEAAEDEIVSTYTLDKAGFRLELLMRRAADLT
jgi:hypothetical protein